MSRKLLVPFTILLVVAPLFGADVAFPIQLHSNLVIRQFPGRLPDLLDQILILSPAAAPCAAWNGFWAAPMTC